MSCCAEFHDQPGKLNRLRQFIESYRIDLYIVDRPRFLSVAGRGGQE